MKNLLWALTVMILFLTGCWSGDGGADGPFAELSDTETLQLRNYVQYNIRRDHRLTEDQRMLIEQAEPVIKIAYDGDKEGKAYISWNIPQTLEYAAKVNADPNAAVPYLTINVRGFGDLSDPNGIRWSVSLVNQSNVTVVDKDAEATGQPNQKTSRKERENLKKK